MFIERTKHLPATLLRSHARDSFTLLTAVSKHASGNKVFGEERNMAELSGFWPNRSFSRLTLIESKNWGRFTGVEVSAKPGERARTHFFRFLVPQSTIDCGHRFASFPQENLRCGFMGVRVHSQLAAKS
jgi:hypothetical protein